MLVSVRDAQQILEAFESLDARDRHAVLVSVLRVEGSAYRRAGARALIGPNEEVVGLISGGCVEGDLVLRAREVRADGVPRSVRYDSTADEDSLFGLGLGCRGKIDVLLERVGVDSPGPLAFLQRCHVERNAGVLVTRASGSDESGRLQLARWMLGEDGPLTGPPLPAGDHRSLEDRARAVRDSGRSYAESDASGTMLFEWLPQRPRLLLLGAGPDAAPLVSLAGELGWQVQVVDPRAGSARLDHFPNADAVMHPEPAEALARIGIDARTAVVIMNHHYERDRAALAAALDCRAGYLGVLGPRARTAEMLDDLRKEGFATTPEQLARLHAPAGLDLGADSSDEVALAIVAEVQAVLAGHRGGFLRDRNAPIHDRSS
jgi:xanthine/CO dehydrogenase XdhC/CoxF family maturation factor